MSDGSIRIVRSRPTDRWCGWAAGVAPEMVDARLRWAGIGRVESDEGFGFAEEIHQRTSRSTSLESEPGGNTGGRHRPMWAKFPHLSVQTRRRALDEMSEATGWSPAEIEAAILLARKAYLRSLDLPESMSDNALRFHVAKMNRRQTRRICVEPGCGEKLPRDAQAHRRYCEEHSSGAARVARHRSRRM